VRHLASRWVRGKLRPDKRSFAEAGLIAKFDVEGSSPFSRSNAGPVIAPSGAWSVFRAAGASRTATANSRPDCKHGHAVSLDAIVDVISRGPEQNSPHIADAE
jgi:hypothetical protein